MSGRGDWSKRSLEERRNYRPSEGLSSSPWATLLRAVFNIVRVLLGKERR